MKKTEVPVVPCGPYSGTPITNAPDEWLVRLAEWTWIKGTLREAVEAELRARGVGL